MPANENAPDAGQGIEGKESTNRKKEGVRTMIAEVTAMCPLRTCDATFTGTPEEAGEWTEAHEQGHLDKADEIVVDIISKVSIDDRSENCGGVVATLDLTTVYGRFGQVTSAEHYVMFGGLRNSLDDAGIPAHLLPELIAELEQFHGIYARRIEAGQ